MSDQTSNADLADRLARRRARIMPVLAFFFLIQQTAYFSHPLTGRAVDHVRLTAWMAMSLVIILVVTTGGFWFRKPEVRAMIDDEVTRANRASAMNSAFVSSMLTAILLYGLQGAVELTAAQSIHYIVSAGLVTVLLRFSILERRALG
jgi:hypothetical protein